MTVTAPTLAEVRRLAGQLATAAGGSSMDASEMPGDINHDRRVPAPPPSGTDPHVTAFGACGLLSPGPGDGPDCPVHRPVVPAGPARYGWCQNTEG